MTDLNILSKINVGDFAAQGKEVYEKIKEDLEKENTGKFVAIEPQSGEYFVAEESMKAINKGKKKHPNKIFYLVKIGFPAVRTMSSHFKPTNYGNIL